MSDSKSHRMTCLGLPDLTSTENPKPIIPCNNPIEDGEDWCEGCGNEMMNRFKNSFADIAQMEAPKAKRNSIMKTLDKVFGKKNNKKPRGFGGKSGNIKNNRNRGNR